MNGSGSDDVPPASAGARFGTILDHLREGVQILDRDWRYLYVNDAACRHGRRAREELLESTLLEMYPGVESTAMFAILDRCMRERVPGEIDNEFEYPDGDRGWFELRVQPVDEGIFVLSIDVQERKSLEVQLLHAQKLETVGRLAGGIAHDFNNLLTAIGSFGELALEALERDHPAAHDLREVLAASGRAEELVGQLLAFSRRKPVRPQAIDVNRQVVDLDTMLRRILGEDVVLATRLSEAPWTVHMDPGAFEQVLINLAVNARDAMPDGGQLSIETGNVELDESYTMTKGGSVIAGDYVALSVTDNGHGMDAATQASIFEPFFTTKDRDVGTGLGLSTCYGIVQQAGGYIWVYSEPGSGTTFKVYLPRLDAPPDRRPAREPAPVVGGSETVLVVEDDPQVREIVTRALRTQGYVVVAAGSADEALSLAADEALAIDLLLTDVVMPGSNGRELADRLQASRPGVKVLYMSGYTEDAVVQQGVLGPGVALVPKPFTPRILGRHVRAVLDA